MTTLLVVTVAVVLMTATAHARTCTGELTDMRVIGLTLGDCDLNRISANELTYLKSVCGEPWSSDNEGTVRKCTITVNASRIKSIPRENHGYGAPLYRVRKVLQAVRPQQPTPGVDAGPGPSPVETPEACKKFPMLC
jgi:hypothetical protein